MRIDRHLNLVIPVTREKGEVYVFSTPISRPVFENYFLVLGKTFSEIYQQNLNVIAGPRVAYLMLKRTAQQMGIWEGAEGVENGLMNEIRRLSNVLAPGKNGWEMTQYQDALNSKSFSDDEVGEIENQLVFFTVVSHLHKKENVKDILDGLTSLWGTLNTYSSCSEWMHSLQTLTKDENSGAKVELSEKLLKAS